MITRREALLGGLSAGIAGSANAAGWCSSPVFPSGERECQVGLQIGAVPTARQRCQNWCWAACIEAIFSWYRLPVAQEVIVEKVYGSAQACRTATGYQIAQAISGEWVSANGTWFQARANVIADLSMGYAQPYALDAVWQNLASNRPLINGAAGHATVLTAMTYLEDTYGRTQLTNITVRDPWPGTPNRRLLTPNEAAGTFFICGVDVFL